MQRRKFISLLDGAAIAWPLTARAQHPEQMRCIGVLMNPVADDREAPARIDAISPGYMNTDCLQRSLAAAWAAAPSRNHARE